MCSQNNTQNDLIITNNDDIQSCETPRKLNYIIPTTSNPKHNVKHIVAMPVFSFNLLTTVKLTPAGKAYTCFQIDGKYAQVAKCVESSIITEVIYYVLSIDTFEQ